MATRSLFAFVLTLVSLVTLLTLVSGVARADEREISLIALIRELRAQGHRILYSSSHVYPGQRVIVAEINMQSLGAALPGLGLELQKQEGVWVITRGNQVQGEARKTQPIVFAEPRIENIIVTGSVHHIPNVGAGSSVHSFTADDMSLTPSLGSDAMRAALRLPGVASVGVSAKPHIRGGLRDELLIMQDGVELLEPFHLADYHSAYSSIDYQTIGSMDVYTGGFPSRYGNRMSGVMDIQNRWEEDDYETSIGLSTFANFIHTGREFGQDHPGTVILSARQGDLSDLTGYIQSRTGEPKYADVAVRGSVELSQGLESAFGIIYAEDDIRFEDEEEEASAQVETGYLWGGLAWEPSAKTSGHLTLSLLKSLREKQLATFEEEAKGGVLAYRQEVQRIALRNDWSTSRFFGARLELGWQAEYGWADYRQHSRIDRGELSTILGTERFSSLDARLEPEGWSAGVYLQTEWPLTGKLTLQPSLRWDFQGYYPGRGNEYQLAPRMGLKYELNEATTARLSVGRFYQPEGIHELQILDGIDQFFLPQHSDQGVLGLEWRRQRLYVVAEVYIKSYREQKGRFENVFNPFVLLPEMEPDRVALFPEKAVAKGVDLEARLSLNQRLNAHLHYSHLVARDKINGRWTDRRWSQRHTCSLGSSFQKGNFSLAAELSWHSGWRSSLLPDFIPEDTVMPVDSVLNNRELKEYLSLDIGARYFWELGKTRLEIYADITNLSDRVNQAGIDFDVEEVDGGIELVPDYEILLRRVTSIGLTFSF